MEGYILVAVFSLSCYRYLGDGGTDRREILHDGTYRPLTDHLPFGTVSQGNPQFRNFGPKFWPFDRAYLEVTALSSLTSARQQLSEKCKSLGSSPPPPESASSV